MNVLIGLLFALEILVALLLGGVVMLQKPKDGGLNTAIGGGFEASLGAQAGSVLTKTTIILGVIFLLNTLVLSRLTAHRGSSVMEDVHTAPVHQTPPTAASTVPAATPAVPAAAPKAVPVPAAEPKAPAAPAAMPKAPAAPAVPAAAPKAAPAPSAPAK